MTNSVPEKTLSRIRSAVMLPVDEVRQQFGDEAIHAWPRAVGVALERRDPGLLREAGALREAADGIESLRDELLGS